MEKRGKNDSKLLFNLISHSHITDHYHFLCFSTSQPCARSLEEYVIFLLSVARSRASVRLILLFLMWKKAANWGKMLWELRRKEREMRDTKNVQMLVVIRHTVEECEVLRAPQLFQARQLCLALDELWGDFSSVFFYFSIFRNKLTREGIFFYRWNNKF